MTKSKSKAVVTSQSAVEPVGVKNEKLISFDDAINDLNKQISSKMNEVFKLLLEHTLKSNEANVELCKLANAPSFLIEEMRVKNPKKFSNRMVEIQEVLTSEFFARYNDEMWMDYMDSRPKIPTQVDGYNGWNLEC